MLQGSRNPEVTGKETSETVSQISRSKCGKVVALSAAFSLLLAACGHGKRITALEDGLKEAITENERQDRLDVLITSKIDNDIQPTVETHTTALGNLNTRVTNTEGEITDMKAEIAAIKTEIATLKEQVAKAIEDLEKQGKTASAAYRKAKFAMQMLNQMEATTPDSTPHPEYRAQFATLRRMTASVLKGSTPSIELGKDASGNTKEITDADKGDAAKQLEEVLKNP